MSDTEATSNIIVAMINNGLLHAPEEVAEAYKTIYQSVAVPYENEE